MPPIYVPRVVNRSIALWGAKTQRTALRPRIFSITNYTHVSKHRSRFTMANFAKRSAKLSKFPRQWITITAAFSVINGVFRWNFSLVSLLFTTHTSEVLRSLFTYSRTCSSSPPLERRKWRLIIIVLAISISEHARDAPLTASEPINGNYWRKWTCTYLLYILKRSVRFGDALFVA